MANQEQEFSGCSPLPAAAPEKISGLALAPNMPEKISAALGQRRKPLPGSPNTAAHPHDERAPQRLFRRAAQSSCRRVTDVFGAAFLKNRQKEAAFFVKKAAPKKPLKIFKEIF